MALFSTKKENKKTLASPRRRKARQTKLAAGVAHEIVRAPWFSEKALIVTEKGVYTFAVPQRATKAEIANAIKEVYKVEPKKIRIINLPGKAKSLRTRRGEGFRAARRKAYVYLNAGDTIQFA
ncbi:MAG: 50S ribosomal protein L23 [Parcubacteria group bacterium GW2011_GWA2_56_21]|nr:MAG: 50S ribosomal protein L23 [Parcubacteria group bacterium GW2011_GWA2_56_21]